MLKKHTYNKHKAKNIYIITARIPKLLWKKIYFFSLSYIKIERIIIDVGEKKNTTEKEFYSSDNTKTSNRNNYKKY